jgi:hypothetical protein
MSNENNDIVISQPWGGLGDNLQFSTLPELYAKKGFNVYIAANNVYRNSEIYDIVWAKNPYVKGIKDKEPNAGSCNHLLAENEYFIHRVELAHGHEKTNLIPKVYQEFNIIEELKDVVIIDITSTTVDRDFKDCIYHELMHMYEEILFYHKKDKIKIIKFNNFEVPSHIQQIYDQYLPNCDTLTISTLNEYCDIINSCNTLLTINSGLQSLASAIKKDKVTPRIICYTPEFFDLTNENAVKGFYYYPNVEYLLSKLTDSKK